MLWRWRVSFCTWRKKYYFEIHACQQNTSGHCNSIHRIASMQPSNTTAKSPSTSTNHQFSTVYQISTNIHFSVLWTHKMWDTRGRCLTQPLTCARLGAYDMSFEESIKWNVLSSWTIKYCTSKFKLIFSFLTKNKIHSKSSVSLGLVLLKH